MTRRISPSDLLSCRAIIFFQKAVFCCAGRKTIVSGRATRSPPRYRGPGLNELSGAAIIFEKRPRGAA
jgi:hypothetical protein